jgi:hypothetical protein
MNKDEGEEVAAALDVKVEVSSSAGISSTGTRDSSGNEVFVSSKCGSRDAGVADWEDLGDLK